MNYIIILESIINSVLHDILVFKKSEAALTVLNIEN